MSREAIEQIIDKWTNDTSFREQMRKDPNGTLSRSAGASNLSEEERQALGNIDWSLPDQQLRERISKAWRLEA